MNHSDCNIEISKKLTVEENLFSAVIEKDDFFIALVKFRWPVSSLIGLLFLVMTTLIPFSFWIIRYENTASRTQTLITRYDHQPKDI